MEVPPSSVWMRSRRWVIAVVEGLRSFSVRLRDGLREDLSIRVILLVDVDWGVAPGGGGAVGVDFGYGGCGG